ncbi:PEP-CTERM protein-sorting domain-containing protein [Duganella sp. CF402]|uniref:PEP-CTERM sorting domain-containing protein n=1 Tax=unclassified Duganella TaxID=2636909 RepID=UPI0008CD604B|nr:MULTISPECIES: PEP-CTERM sorting domain-containing protein [unclassified Duganella]RZT10158.1 putative secreted protein with PEP-CTERM sorting signal [Duganella sp. BK701]SEL25615.1 PEP-CTERM protein-sorting domain-containing protein [Duganella sp. CF402]
MKLLKTAALAALLATGAAHASSELLINGSFEADTQGYNSWNIYSTLTGWTGVGAGIELRNNVVGVAPDGLNFVELDTTANSAMYQNVSTALNQSYTLTFQFQDRPGVSTSSQGLEISWGGNVVGTVNNSAGGNWQTVSYTLLGTGNIEALSFRAIGTSDSLGTSLDNVSLTAAVPEPETYAMLLAGLGLVGFAARRRKQ